MSDSEGMVIARRRIAREKEERTGFLDLGNLGLTEWPEELWELGHLVSLNLGLDWFDAAGNRGDATGELGDNRLPQTDASWGHLSGLQALSIGGSWGERNHWDDLRPLSPLRALRHLSCSQTHVSSLEPLAGLTDLASLDCSYSQVSSLEPLVALTALTYLECVGTPVSSLEPLVALTALTSLDCSITEVNSLEPLAALTALTSLRCFDTPVRSIPNWLTFRTSLEELWLSGPNLAHLPSEVLSFDYGDNCLPRLRAHHRDLEAGDALLPDVKVLLLGNGRVGKTQIANRLRGRPFEPEADSTHGITVATTPFGDDTLLRLWDFGGQDLYHGTHALFMRSRAVLMLVWTPDSEDSETHEFRGLTFRNHRLGYWLAHAAHLAGGESPVLIVQNQCDRPGAEILPPVDNDALSPFAFRKVLSYSALEPKHGSPALHGALRQAVDHIRENEGQARIGMGRLAVKERLDALREADAACEDTSARRYRTLSQEHFFALCNEEGGVSDPALLLDYLHRSGVVFYQRGLFGDRIILDQAWALDAIYTVFNRAQCWQELKRARGRFTRSLLQPLVWQHYGQEEQQLFLSMMESCGICFTYRYEDKRHGVEAEYIAPELLPDLGAVETEVSAWWGDDLAYEETAVGLPFLHPGVMRNLIARIGGHAGMAALYWKDGVCLYEKTSRCHARIDQVVSKDCAWSGSIRIRAQGGSPSELLGLLREWTLSAARRAGCKVNESAARARFENTTAGHPAKELRPDFVPPPRDAITYAVSYAWEDSSKTTVDELCKKASDQGIRILRDTDALQRGESIARFMDSLVEQDRLFVILSDKYLKSPYCMYELWNLWRKCSQEPDELRKRVRVFRLPDAGMMTVAERARCAIHWKGQFKEIDDLVRDHGASILGVEDFRRYKLMQDFASRVGDVLWTIADTLLPRDFEDLVESGLE